MVDGTERLGRAVNIFYLLRNGKNHGIFFIDCGRNFISIFVLKINIAALSVKIIAGAVLGLRPRVIIAPLLHLQRVDVEH